MNQLYNIKLYTLDGERGSWIKTKVVFNILFS